MKESSGHLETHTASALHLRVLRVCEQSLFTYSQTSSPVCSQTLAAKFSPLLMSCKRPPDPKRHPECQDKCKKALITFEYTWMTVWGPDAARLGGTHMHLNNTAAVGPTSRQFSRPSAISFPAHKPPAFPPQPPVHFCHRLLLDCDLYKLFTLLMASVCGPK